MIGKRVFLIIIMISMILNLLLFYHINNSPIETVVKTLRITGPIEYVFLILLIVYSIKLGTPKMIALLFLIPTAYIFLSIFIIDFMAELFSIQIIVSLRSLGFCLLLFIACISNYRFSKSKVFLVIGIFVMIRSLVVSINFMGIALPWSGSLLLEMYFLFGS
ncbi:hypothetical protein RI065_08470 [Mycoplasmatota bacterium zrk1]